MDPLQKTLLRLVIYGAFIGYLLADLIWFEGPLHKRVHAKDPDTPEAIAAAKAAGVVARVFNHTINRSQLERALHERLMVEGRSPADLDAATLRVARLAALNDLIDHQLLRVKAKAHAASLPVDDAEVERRFREIATAFSDENALAAALRAQGLGTTEDFRKRIAGRIQQELYIEFRIAPLIGVTDEEIDAVIAERTAELQSPEKVRVRHIFLPVGPGDDPDEVREKLEVDADGFDALAKTLSADPSTRDRGGDIGWVTRDDLPADLAEPVFLMESGVPEPIRTRLGWHLVEVTDRRPPAPLPPDAARDEVRRAITAFKRERAIADFRDALRRFEGHKIRVFHDML